MKTSLRHRFKARGFVAGILGSICINVAATAGEPDSTRRHELPLPATTACLDAQLAAGRAQSGLSGIAVVAIRDGHVVYRRNFGTVSPTSTQPVKSSTRFRIGSVTKVLTATAVLSLADDRRLHLHAPATQLLPGFSLPGDPAWMDRLTAHQLLSNQGGIADPSDAIGPSDDGALAAAFYDSAFTSTIPLMVSPGTFYNYSSTNFMLAGLLAEAAAGKPYRLVVRQRVFKPLGMKRAAFQSSEVTADNDVAFGVGTSEIYVPGAYDDSVERPAGMAWASADDLALFAKFMLRGNREVLSTRHWKAMQTAQADTVERPPGAFLGYGYGLAVAADTELPDSTGQMRFYPGVKMVWHEGAVPGYRALMVTLPNQQFGYVALVNGDVDIDITDSMPCMRKAAAEAVGTRLPQPAPFPLSQIERDRFVDYVGQYDDPLSIGGPAFVTLTAAGDLHIQFPNLDAAGYGYDPILHPVNRDNFILVLQDGELLVTGFRESGSNVKYLRTRLTVFARAGTAAGSPATATRRAAAPAVDVDALKRELQSSAKEHSILP
jgi:CubicO group peptidase (beta-lactamase class C family)